MKTDALLLSSPAPALDPAELALRLAAAGRSWGGEPVRITVHRLSDGPLRIAYCWLGAALDLSPVEAREALAAAGALEGADASLNRLSLIQDLAGAAHGRPAPIHYVVNTDVTPGWEEELENWYDREHLAGLAAVPGTVRARRLRNLDAGPAYYACYDIERPDVVGSPEWMTVRGTDWSSRVRPQFRDPRRLMFETISPGSEEWR